MIIQKGISSRAPQSAISLSLEDMLTDLILENRITL